MDQRDRPKWSFFFNSLIKSELLSSNDDDDDGGRWKKSPKWNGEYVKEKEEFTFELTFRVYNILVDRALLRTYHRSQVNNLSILLNSLRRYEIVFGHDKTFSSFEWPKRAFRIHILSISDLGIDLVFD